MSACNFFSRDEDLNGLPLLVFDAEDEEESELFDCCYFYDIHRELQAMNDEARFFHAELVSGYYVGVQFCLYYNDWYSNPDDLDNAGCWYYHNCNRSTARRMRDAENRRMIKAVTALARKYGFIELVQTGTLSDGSGLYRRVS